MLAARDKAAIPKRIEGKAVKVPDRTRFLMPSAECSAFCRKLGVGSTGRASSVSGLLMAF